MKNEEQTQPAQRLELLPAAAVRRSPYQVRREEVPGPEMLASVAVHGLINPITVRPLPDGAFEIVAGHRRFAAFREVRPGEPIPAIVLDADDMTAEDLLVSENFFRRDLSLMEEAMSVAQLRAHGRTVEQVAAVVHKSERWVYRRIAIGGVAVPWREFLHAWDASYDTAAAVARLPPDVQALAWSAFLAYLADECDFQARRGDADGARYRDGFVAEADAARCDKAALCKLMAHYVSDAAVPERRAAEIVLSWFEPGAGLHKFAGDHRVLDRKFCSFDFERDCRNCTKRSDVQPDWFAADDAAAARSAPRCHDGECWREKCKAAEAARKQQESPGRSEPPPSATPGTDGNNDESASASPSGTCSAAPPESGKKEGASSPDPAAGGLASSSCLRDEEPAPDRASSSSPAPAPRTAPENVSVGTDAAGIDWRPARAEDPISSAPAPAADVAARMGAVWACALLLSGETLESILPSVGGLKVEEMRRGGWRAAVEKKALPRLKRNRDEAAGVLKALAAEGMW
ncbi:MAG: ParB/RepB/Spo0J family partition protein [Kiritimatiellae bacterium]|nr:ParB/RepB/Spo0J family partition protein [Kiritimatiellia bacterium]